LKGSRRDSLRQGELEPTFSERGCPQPQHARYRGELANHPPRDHFFGRSFYPKKRIAIQESTCGVAFNRTRSRKSTCCGWGQPRSGRWKTPARKQQNFADTGEAPVSKSAPSSERGCPQPQHVGPQVERPKIPGLVGHQLANAGIVRRADSRLPRLGIHQRIEACSRWVRKRTLSFSVLRLGTAALRRRPDNFAPSIMRRPFALEDFHIFHHNLGRWLLVTFVLDGGC
jgi:hypothetical protein